MRPETVARYQFRGSLELEATRVVQDVETALAGVTLRKAELLALFADLRTQAYAAGRMGITVSGVASQVEDLKALTGCDSVAELGRWWLAHREAWVALHARVARTPPDIAPDAAE